MTKNHAGFFFLPVNIQQSSQLVYHSSDRHIADAPRRGDRGRGGRKRNEQEYYQKRVQREAPDGFPFLKARPCSKRTLTPLERSSVSSV